MTEEQYTINNNRTIALEGTTAEATRGLKSFWRYIESKSLDNIGVAPIIKEMESLQRKQI